MKSLTTSSLKIKLLIPILLTSTLVLITMASITGYKVFGSAQNDAVAKTKSEAKASANLIRLEIEQALGVARGMRAALVANRDAQHTSRQEAINLGKRMLADNPKILAMGVAWEPNAWDRKDESFVDAEAHDKTGRFVPYITRGSEGKFDVTALVDYETPGAGDYYLMPKKIKEEFVTDAYFYPINGEQVLMTSAIVPILIKGDFYGISAVDISLKEVAGMVDKLRPYPESQAYLITASGMYLTNPAQDLITKPAKFPFEESRILEAIRNGTEMDLIGVDPADKKEYLYTLTPFYMGKHATPWTLVIRTPSSAIVAGAKSLLWDQAIISVLSLFAIAGAVWLIATWLSKSLESVSDRINESGTMVGNAIEQLSTAGKVLSEAASTSAASLEETVASLEELTSMVEMNSQNANQAARLSEQTSGNATQGEAEMQKLLESMTAISASSKKIEEIIQVIDDIAFQTNLLALNASVEAARAGEHGKGFAVVAEAVRTLAQRAATAAKDITSLIKDSVGMIEDGQQKADLSGEKLREIVGAIRKVSALNAEIATASQEQSTGIQQISKAMNQLDQSVQSNAASSEEIAGTSEEILRQAEKMKGAAHELLQTVKGQSAQ